LTVVDCSAWHEVERELQRAGREGMFHYVVSYTCLWLCRSCTT